MKILRTASLGPNFTGSYKKQSVDIYFGVWRATLKERKMSASTFSMNEED